LLSLALCVQTADSLVLFVWVLLGNTVHPGGGEPHQRRPLSHHCGDDQEGVASELARHAEGDGGAHQPRGEGLADDVTGHMQIMTKYGQCKPQVKSELCK